MDPLPAPRLNLRRVAAVSVAAFTVFGVIAAIVLTGNDSLNSKEKAGILVAMVVGSLLIGSLPHLFELGSTMVSRVRHYGAVIERNERLDGAVARTVHQLRLLNRDIAIQEIRDVQGTVHLVFPYGTNSGVGQGMLIEVVRQTGGERLGTVTIVRAEEHWSLAAPADRAMPDFWDGLENRMRSDFSPPVAVVGRVFHITGSTVTDLLRQLEEESGVAP